MSEGGGFFKRLNNLFRGFLSLWISDVEKEHPEIAYENAINSMLEKFARLKRATAAIIRRRDEIQERFTPSPPSSTQVSGRPGRGGADGQGRPGPHPHPEEEHPRKGGGRAEDGARDRGQGRRRGQVGAHPGAGRDQEAQGREGQHARQDGERQGARAHPGAARRAVGRRRGQGARERARPHQEHHRPGQPRQGAGRHLAGREAAAAALAVGRGHRPQPARRAEGQAGREEGRARRRCDPAGRESECRWRR